MGQVQRSFTQAMSAAIVAPPMVKMLSNQCKLGPMSLPSKRATIAKTITGTMKISSHEKTGWTIYKFDHTRTTSRPAEVTLPRIYLSREVAAYECERLGSTTHHIKEVVIADFYVNY